MREHVEYTRFSVTMIGALLVFLGAAVLANAGDVTAFVVRLAGFACAVFGMVIFCGHLIRARSIDAIPFEELVGSVALIFFGAAVAFFPAFFAKVFFSTIGVFIVASGLGDIARSRSMLADDDQRQRSVLRMGIVTVAVGIFVTFVPSAAVRVVPVICGIALVLDGISELYLALSMSDR